jgi:DNA invertase Pin-like site-specific DNA recombinase
VECQPVRSTDQVRVDGSTDFGHLLPLCRYQSRRTAAVAQQEGEAISRRTKAALAAAKARGKKLGGRLVSAERLQQIGTAARLANMERAERMRAEIMPAIAKLQAEGANSLRQIAAGLNAKEMPTPRGAGEWSAIQVQRVLKASAPRKKPTSPDVALERAKVA